MEFFSKRAAAVKKVFSVPERSTLFVNNHIDEPGQLYVEPHGHHPVLRYEYDENDQVTQLEYGPQFPLADVLDYLATAGLEVTAQTIINEVAEVSERVFTVSIAEPSLVKLAVQTVRALATGRAA